MHMQSGGRRREGQCYQLARRAAQLHLERGAAVATRAAAPCCYRAHAGR